ncbi:hypothetical protein AB4Z52_26615 [Rhizobium sp. 2YAF20]|uniref:hypothetical protein n=1 Tax=Rhizobium sp. 2YAF20 TaxID=3233027 RepID=UPI003F947E63
MAGHDRNFDAPLSRLLFQDVYRWAGKYRTVRTSKGGSTFCFPEYIDGEMNQLFATLKRSFAAEIEEQFVCEAAEIISGSICGTADTLIGFGLSTLRYSRTSLIVGVSPIHASAERQPQKSKPRQMLPP